MVANALNQRLSEVIAGTGAESAGWTVPAATYWPNAYLHFFSSATDTLTVAIYTATTPGTKRVLAVRSLPPNQDGTVYLGNLNTGDRITFQLAGTGVAWLDGGVDS